jgi:peroxiredoxin
MGRLFLGILRMTYLIDPKGQIVKTYPKVNPTVHASEILTYLQDQALKV